jgi:hypothetical protein
VRRMLMFAAVFSALGLCANAELFVIKMKLTVRVVDPSSGNLSNVTITATNIVEAAGEDPATATLVLDSEAPGAMSIYDNETGDFLADFVADTTSDRSTAVSAFGTKQYCHAFLDFFDGTGGAGSAVGPIDRRIDSASGLVTRYNWNAKIQGNLDTETFGLPGTSAPFYGTFSSLKRFVATTAPPCSAPTAITTAASDIGITTATLHATVNPNGRATQAGFQYGLTPTYGNSTSSQSVGSGTSDTGATANLTELLPGQTYHYRVTASSTCGSVLGSDMTFTTSTLTNSLATSSLAK